MKKNQTNLLLAWLSVGLLTACFSSRREEVLRTDLRGIELKIADLDKEILLRDKSIDIVKGSADENRNKLQATRTEVDELHRQIDILQNSLEELRSKPSINRNTETSLSRRVQEESNSPKFAELENKLNRLENSWEKRLTKLELIFNNFKNQDSNATKSVLSSSFKSPSQYKQSLYSLLSQKQHRKAIKLAEQGIASEVSPEFKETAFMVAGEAYFALQEYEKAALNFNEFLDRANEQHEKRPRALLLLGDSFVYLKKNSLAKQYYNECVQTFSEKPECKAAKDRLDKLAGG